MHITLHHLAAVSVPRYVIMMAEKRERERKSPSTPYTPEHG